MITEWVPVLEPPVLPTFLFPSYATDLQILNAANGLVMVTLDGTQLYRLYVDFDGAIATELIGPFNGALPGTSPPVTPPFPVFGQVAGDLMILSPGLGVLMPAGLPSTAPRLFYRLQMDNDGAPRTQQVPIATWIQIPEHAIPLAVDAQKNWVFTTDVIILTPGQGVVFPMRGGSGVRRVRIDFDGAILSE